MKKLLTFKVVLIVLAFLVFSCKDKDPVAKKNAFTYDGVTYDLSNGWLLGYGANADSVSSDYDITLYSSGLSIDSLGDFTGTGHMVYLDLNVSGTGSFVPGTFTWSDTRSANTIVYGDFTLDIDTGAVTSGTSGSFNGGTVTVEVSGSTYTVDFKMTMANGKTVEGYYSGPLTLL